MHSSNTFVVLELARQKQAALARQTRRGHVVQARTHARRWRRFRPAAG